MTSNAKHNHLTPMQKEWLILLNSWASTVDIVEFLGENWFPDRYFGRKPKLFWQDKVDTKEFLGTFTHPRGINTPNGIALPRTRGI